MKSRLGLDNRGATLQNVSYRACVSTLNSTHLRKLVYLSLRRYGFIA